MQMLEERDEEISRLREAEHDLSMSLDRVVYELQNDIQKSKEENSTLQAKLQVRSLTVSEIFDRQKKSLCTSFCSSRVLAPKRSFFFFSFFLLCCVWSDIEIAFDNFLYPSCFLRIKYIEWEITFYG